jgi:glycopeptide antibiotics resistance protein
MWIAVILVITLWPDPNPQRGLNLVPLRSVERLFVLLRLEGYQGAGAQVWALNILGNLLLFLPVGWLLFHQLRARRALGVILASLALSLAIELYQLRSAQRTADIDDVIFNLTGALLGMGCARLQGGGRT